MRLRALLPCLALLLACGGKKSNELPSATEYQCAPVAHGAAGCSAIRLTFDAAFTDTAYPEGCTALLTEESGFCTNVCPIECTCKHFPVGRDPDAGPLQFICAD